MLEKQKVKVEPTLNSIFGDDFGQRFRGFYIEKSPEYWYVSMHDADGKQFGNRVRFSDGDEVYSIVTRLHRDRLRPIVVCRSELEHWLDIY